MAQQTVVYYKNGTSNKYDIQGTLNTRFSGNTSIVRVEIGEGVTIINKRAFWKCTSLTSVTIPNTIKNIISETFRGCTSLTSVTLPNSVVSIGDSAFDGCTSLPNYSIALEYADEHGMRTFPYKRSR